MALTDVAVRQAKPGPKVIRLKDDRGLYLEISPAPLYTARYFGGKSIRGHSRAAT
jgi:hypothetical protein